MEHFSRTTNGFNFVYEKTIPEGADLILKMPAVSSNKRSVNDIGWQTDGNVELYGTLSGKPESDRAVWQLIESNDDINKTVTALRIVNKGPACNVAVKAILC